MSNFAVSKPIVVIGGTGKTGSRVRAMLEQRGLPVRAVSRSTEPRFDWDDTATWARAISGAAALYITFQPDLAVPGAVQAIQLLTSLAKLEGIPRLVLLSGRGEEEAQDAERVLQKSDADWTIVRASWFAQNFSESFLLDSLLAGEVALPVGPVAEPFIDADDIAEIVVKALTEEGHAGEVYEVTGPRLLTFADAVAEIAAATGRPLRYTQVPRDAYADALRNASVPDEFAGLLDYLFTTVLDGRNASTTDTVQRVLGRPARDFSDYVAQTAATGIWKKAA